MNSTVTVRFTKPLAELLLALPVTISVERKNPLSYERENGLWRAFLLAAGNPVAL